jgi:hypothetical protein
MVLCLSCSAVAVISRCTRHVRDSTRLILRFVVVSHVLHALVLARPRANASSGFTTVGVDEVPQASSHLES